MTLDARVVVRLGGLDLDLDLTVEDGEVVAILGPNGAGKTTTLRALAGLTPLYGGHVRLDGDTLEEPSRAIRVPVEQRPVGVVFQDYLLFPHMSALDNVAYGLRRAGCSRQQARSGAAEWLNRFGLGDHSGAKPGQLSGGQQQRVTLARALATGPRLLLLDEPLAALDATTRNEMRRELRRHLAEFSGVRILVTHDPLDALALADRLTIIEAGRVVQTGTPVEVTAAPRSRYVADLVGLNLFRGTGRAGAITLAGGAGLTVVGPHVGEVFAVIHPRAVTLHPSRPDTSARNTWPGTISDVDLRGEVIRVHVRADSPGLSIVAEVTTQAYLGMQLRAGSNVWVAVKATEIDVYPT